MDGRVPVTPTRLWIQPTGGTVKTPNPAQPSQRTAIKPKTPEGKINTYSEKTKQSTVGDEMLAEFGLTKEEITPTSRKPTVSATQITQPARTAVKTQRSPVTPTPVQQSSLQQSSLQQSSLQQPTVQQPTVQQSSLQQSSLQQPTVQQPTVQQPTVQHTIRYTDAEIDEMLTNGYLCITRELWEFLPIGSHVRFFKKGAGSKNERFRPGGFIKKHYITADGKRILLMETVRGGTSAITGYITYPMTIDDLDEIWKRYPEECFIEIHLIHNSLVNKNKIINDLVARVSAIESRIKKANN